MATEKKNDVEKKKTVREITFKLTDEELLAKGREAADVRLLKSAVEEEFARIKSTYKGRIESAEFQLSAILHIIKEGKEKRVVDIEDHFDYTAGVVRTYFKDEKVEERLMTLDERQLGLGFVDKKAQAEEAA